MKHTTILCTACILLVCAALFCGCTDTGTAEAAPSVEAGAQTDASIIVYCGAGMREPMEEIGKAFEDETGVTVCYTFAGSNTLLSQMELTGIGDVYMPGATYYFEAAQEKGFVEEDHLVAYHVPIIAVPRGNPAGITCLDDLADDGVKVELGDPSACAIGKLADQILEKNGIFEDVDANVVSRGATVNELVVHTALGQVDASIIWEDLYKEDTMERINIPKEQNIFKVVPIGLLTFSENKDAASAFVTFVAAEDGGKEIFRSHGFTTYPNEAFEG